MMKKLITLTLMFSFLFSDIAFSQNAETAIKENVFANPYHSSSQTYIRMMKNNVDDLDEQILFEEWKKAKIYYNEFDFIEVDSANVNIKLDEVLVVKDGQLKVVKFDMVSRVDIEGESAFVMKSFINDKSEPQKALFEVLVPGSIQLMKKYEIAEVRTSDNPLLSSMVYEVDYQRKSKLFVEDDKARIFKLPKRKSDILKIFKNKKGSMQKYATENKISNRKENDLVELFDYYNSI